MKLSREDQKTIPIIDTHQHLWNLNLLKLDWLNEQPYNQLTKNYLLDDYASATQGHNICKTIYMEVDVRPEQFMVEIEFILDLCRNKQNRLVGAVFGGRPSSRNFGDYIARFRNNNYVKGIRQVLKGLHPNEFLHKDFIAGVRLLGDYGLVFDIEAPAEQMKISKKLCESCPDTQFILDHCGHPEFQSADISLWQRNLEDLAKQDNVVVKLSGILAHAKNSNWSVEELSPPINHLIDVFGSDRVMFGSDWPVVNINGTFSSWVNALMKAVTDRPLDDQKKIFYDNATRIYGL